MRATEQRSTEARDSVVIELRDTVREVTTITIRENENGDTIKVVQVTDRERGRSRDAIAVQKTKVEIVRDTVYVERRDSVEVRNNGVTGNQSGKTALHTTLRLVLWIIVAVIALIIVVRIRNPAG